MHKEGGTPSTPVTTFLRREFKGVGWVGV